MQFQTLPELMDQAAAVHRDNDCFGTKQANGSWEWMTYGEVGLRVSEAKSGLGQLGVGRGSRVAIISNNRVEWAVIAFATFALGAVLVPMYEAQEADEWKFILEDSSAKVVVAANSQIAAKIESFRSELPALSHVIALDKAKDDPNSYAALLAHGAKAPAPRAEVSPQDQAAQLYTSGTTGAPKGVQLSHANFCTNVLASCSRFDFGPGDRSLAFLPWAHAFGQVAELYTFFNFGAALAINDEIPNIVANLAVVRPTILVAVPRIFNRIYDGVNKQMAAKPAVIRKLFRAGVAAATKRSRGEKLDLAETLALRAADKLIFGKVRMRFGGRLRFVVSGSAALSTEVAEFIDALGIDVFEGYGLTETSPVVSVNYPGSRKIGSVGKALPGVEIRIDRAKTEDGAHGEIVVSGPNVMMGYFERPEDNAQVLMPDGSFRTGDMGFLDADGFLYITGRIKEQYKLETGKYVVPSPLEEQLKLSPFVSNVLLYGANKPHNVALVVLDAATVDEWAKARGLSTQTLAENAELKKLVLSELEKYSKSFKSYERPKAVVLTLEEFTTENGMLTPKMSIKRRNVLAKYQARLDALYTSS
jgi:long-chain acyl-CoA synthetase